MNDPYTLTTDRAAEPDLGHQSDTPWRRGRDIAPELGRHLDRRLRDGCAQLANRAPQQRIARLGVRPQVPLRGEHEPRFVGRRSRRRGDGHRRQRRSARRWAVATSTSCLAACSSAIAPKPGTGPSERARENGHYTVETYTTTSSGARYRATMAQRGDPGYKATSVLLGECALALAFDRDELSELHGVLTPAASPRRRFADAAARGRRHAGDRRAVLNQAAPNACQPRSKRLVSQARLRTIPATKVDTSWLVSTSSSTRFRYKTLRASSAFRRRRGEHRHPDAGARAGRRPAAQRRRRRHRLEQARGRRHEPGGQRSARRRRERRPGRPEGRRQDRRPHLRRQRQQPGRVGTGGGGAGQQRSAQAAAADPGADRAGLHRQAADQGQRGARHRPRPKRRLQVAEASATSSAASSAAQAAVAVQRRATTRSAASWAACWRRPGWRRDSATSSVGCSAARSSTRLGS